MTRTAQQHAIERLMTEQEVLGILGLKSRKVLWQLRSAGKLRYVRIGARTVRYAARDVEALITASTSAKRGR